MSKQNKLNLKSVLNITVRLLLVCSIIAAVVAGVNALTVERIAENEAKVINETIRSVFVEGKITGTDYEQDDKSVTSIYRVDDESDGSVLGYSVICAPSGFGGEIQMMVAFDANKAITSVRVMSHSETPGIGDKINSADEAWFTEQFAGKNSQLSFGNDVDKITGSSKSSNAVLAGVNDAIAAINELN